MGGHDIFVRLETLASGYQVSLAIGETAEAPYAFSFDASPTTRTAQVVRDVEQGICSNESLRDIGAQLWDGLLPQAMAVKVRQAVEATEGFVTFYLQVPEALARLPWESLYDGSLRYIACHPRINVVHLAGDAPRRASPQATERVSMLVVVPEGSGLDVETELANLRNAVAKVADAVELVPLRGAVYPDRLADELRTRKWNVLHFIGHGRVDDNRVEIRLNDEGRGELWRNADEFASIFQESPVDVCVLNCCHGGTATNVKATDRLAPALMSAGVGGVVAMRYAMADHDAIRFSQTFYQQLLRGTHAGCVGYAAQLARKALLANASGDQRRGFVTPVVHLAGSTQVFFTVHSARPQAAINSVRPGPQPDLVPARLREAIERQICVPVVGLDLVSPPATRRAAAGVGLRNLVESLGSAAAGAIAPDEDPFPVPTDARLSRIAERYEASGDWQRFVQMVRDFYAPLQPTELHRTLASWKPPGIFYTPFDGLMEAAYSAADRMTVVRSLTEPAEGSESMLVLVRGTINDHRSLVLTEHDHFDLGDRIERMHPTLRSLAHGHLSRCVVFLGAHPADPVVRRIGRKLLGTRGPEAYFVWGAPDSDDDCFWKKFNVRFVRADTETFLRATKSLAARAG